MNGNARPKLKRGMLNLCFLLSLLFTCAQAVYYIDSDGAYIYNNASEIAKLIFLPPVPVYLAGFGKLQDIDGRNGTFKHFYNSSQVNMDYIDTVLAKRLYYNSDTNESVSKPHTEASRSYSVELTRNPIGKLIETVMSRWLKPRKRCSKTTYHRNHFYYGIETCTTAKYCDLDTPWNITKEAESLFMEDPFWLQFQTGSYIHEHGPEWRTCLQFYRDNVEADDKSIPACPPGWCGNTET